MTYFRIDTPAGDEIATLHGLSEDEAIIEAKTRLEDDPELGELHVCRVQEEHVWTITNVPTNTSGDSEIQALRAGEPIPDPGYGKLIQMWKDELDPGYDISDPKHPRYHSVHVDLYDSRDKTAGV